MTDRSKAWLSTLVRFAVCAAALVWLWANTDWGRLHEVLTHADWKLVLVGLLVFGPAPVLIALRLKVLLKVQGIELSLWESAKVTFAGNFIINTLPLGTGGGDTVKAYYIARNTPHKHEAVTAVFFDRIIGVLGLFLMSGFMVLLDWHNPAFAFWGRVIGLSLLALACGAVVYFSRRIRRLVHFDQILARLPLAQHLQRIDRAALVFRSHPRRLLACFALTALLQVISIVAYFLAGWALGLVGDEPAKAFPIYLAYTPIGFLAGALPIGAMEVTFGELFAGAAKLGPAEAAVSLSILGRAMQLAWALPGALVVLKAGPRGTAVSNPKEDEPTP